MLPVILFAVSLIIWITIMVTDRRTVGSGFFLLLTVFLGGIALYRHALLDPGWFSEHLFWHIILDLEIVFLAVILIAYPLILIPFFFVEGVILIKKEGVRPRNVLSIGLAILLLAFDLLFPLFYDVHVKGAATYVYWYMTLISLYLIVQLASFGLSNLLNLIHIKKDQGLNYIVVLGCALRGSELTPLLRARVDRGIKAHRDNPGSKLIMSGGQGGDEIMPESHAMGKYALSAGVPEEDIILEDKSKNTEENIRFSSALMEKSGRFGIATNSYHVMRSLLIARRQKLSCIGYGAHTKLYFSLNAFLREYAGYFRDSRMKRIIHLALLTVIYILFLIFSEA